VDGQGQPKKKRGYMIRGRADLKELTKILYDQWLVKLVRILEAVNPKAVRATRD
jgi:hypothetical protein